MHFSVFVVAALAVPCLSAAVSNSAQTVQNDLESLSSKAAAFNQFMKQTSWSKASLNSRVQDVNEYLNQLTSALQKSSDGLKKDAQYQAQQGQQFSNQYFSTDVQGRQGEQLSSQSASAMNQQHASQSQDHSYGQQQGAGFSSSGSSASLSNSGYGQQQGDGLSNSQVQARSHTEKFSDHQASKEFQNENCYIDGNTATCMMDVSSRMLQVSSGTGSGSGSSESLISGVNSMATNFQSAISAFIAKKEEFSQCSITTQNQLRQTLYNLNQRMNEFADTFSDWAQESQRSQALGFKEQVASTLRGALKAFGVGGY
ncbi:hypothetical protein BDQ17DRAFT_1428304 [Cyathus striatus]|nr:hypothetical protein BDQ17DRAFT_1428304 [Cyathus striatus]